MSPYQYGFMDKKSTTDAVLHLDYMLRRRTNKKYVAGFLDIKSAYDSLERKLV